MLSNWDGAVPRQIDAIDFAFVVTKFASDEDLVDGPPEDGCYVRGLFIGTPKTSLPPLLFQCHPSMYVSLRLFNVLTLLCQFGVRLWSIRRGRAMVRGDHDAAALQARHSAGGVAVHSLLAG